MVLNAFYQAIFYKIQMVKINYYINRYTYENVLLLIKLNKILFIKIFNSYRY